MKSDDSDEPTVGDAVAHLSQESASLLALHPDSVVLDTRVAGASVTRIAAADGPSALAGQSRHDAALVLGVLESLPHRRGVELLQALRDVYASRILVGVQAPEWTRSRFLGLGFTTLGMHRNDLGGSSNQLALYGYDLATYKHTPDWLNADYWANPDLFGRYRW